MSSLPGYGDEATWPPCVGHPNDPRTEPAKWDCRDGMPDEDHDWRIVCGDQSVGLGDYMECRECGKTREATDQEIADSWVDEDDL